LPVRKTGVTTAGTVSWPCAPDRRAARAACRRSPRGGLRWPAARSRAIPAKGALRRLSRPNRDHDADRQQLDLLRAGRRGEVQV